jgi:hypothetical protein
MFTFNTLSNKIPHLTLHNLCLIHYYSSTVWNDFHLFVNVMSLFRTRSSYSLIVPLPCELVSETLNELLTNHD